MAWFTNDSAARSAYEPSAAETPPLSLAREEPAGCPATLRPARIGLCGRWSDVQELCTILSDRARLTWYGDPQAIGPQDVIVYVEDDSGAPWSTAWVREARSRASGAPILVVTRGALPREEARYAAAGATSCIEWGLGAENVAVRVLGAASPYSATYPSAGCARVQIDATLRMARIGNAVARLTTTEMLILQYLVHHSDRWKTAGEILHEVLGNHHCPQTPVVRVHVFRLRRALGEMGPCIESHQGKGYRFTVRRVTMPPPEVVEADVL